MIPDKLTTLARWRDATSAVVSELKMHGVDAETAHSVITALFTRAIAPYAMVTVYRDELTEQTAAAQQGTTSMGG